MSISPRATKVTVSPNIVPIMWPVFGRCAAAVIVTSEESTRVLPFAPRPLAERVCTPAGSDIGIVTLAEKVPLELDLACAIVVGVDAILMVISVFALKPDPETVTDPPAGTDGSDRVRPPAPADGVGVGHCTAVEVAVWAGLELAHGVVVGLELGLGVAQLDGVGEGDREGVGDGDGDVDGLGQGEGDDA